METLFFSFKKTQKKQLRLLHVVPCSRDSRVFCNCQRLWRSLKNVIEMTQQTEQKKRGDWQTVSVVSVGDASDKKTKNNFGGKEKQRKWLPASALKESQMESGFTRFLQLPATKASRSSCLQSFNCQKKSPLPPSEPPAPSSFAICPGNDTLPKARRMALNKGY